MELRINNIGIKIDHKFRFIIASVTLIIYLIGTFQGEYIYYRMHSSLYSLYTAEIVQIEETEPEYVGGGHYASYIYTWVKVGEEYYDIEHKLGDKVGEQVTVAINNIDKSKYTRNEYLFWSHDKDVYFWEPTILIAAICLYIVWLFFIMKDRSENADINEEPLNTRLSNLEQAVVHKKKENKNYLSFAKKFYSVFQKPLPDELSWILRWSDLTQFDNSFLFEEDVGNYALVEETLKIRLLGLPDNYVVFRKLEDTYYAIGFEDENVYSFDIQRIDELQCVGAFYIYIIDYLEGRLVK